MEIQTKIQRKQRNSVQVVKRGGTEDTFLLDIAKKQTDTINNQCRFMNEKKNHICYLRAAMTHKNETHIDDNLDLPVSMCESNEMNAETMKKKL